MTVDSLGVISHGSLMEVNGRPAISYYDSTNGDLKFIRATDAGGGTLWPADIAVDQPADTEIVDGGSKNFGVVPVGTTADLVFTVRNPNSGSEDLTELALSIDGPDATEFSIITRPVTPLSGGAVSSFTVRYVPVTPGMKTATLHIASSATGSKNPYDITLTGASVPEIIVEQPAGSSLADGETRNFPMALSGNSADMVFTVKNPGGFELSGLDIVIDGPDSGEFSMIDSPASRLAPGDSTSFTLRYTAASPGVKTAMLHIFSNVSGSRNPFDIVLMVVPGTLDLTFNPANLTVTSITVQPDGKILAGGYSNGFNRVLPNGSREAPFIPNVNFSVHAALVQTDGKIIIGGTFTTVGGSPHARIARLNPDGTVDGGFNLNANNEVLCLAPQKDGKVLVGGSFNTFGGQPRNFIARLNVDGSLDAEFNPNVSGQVRSMATQEDGKIIIGGGFSAVGDTPRYRIARLHPDGSLDAAWNLISPGEVRSIAIQPDGKILIGGLFTSIGGLMRINTNGSIDFGFNSNANANGTVLSIVLQADGKMVVAGEFTSIGGVTRNRIARLNPDGTTDTTFDPKVNSPVHGLALQPDGRILIGGTFTTIGGTSRFGFARLNNNPATAALRIPEASRVEWLRSGSSPELEQVNFEVSTDGGNTFIPLGAGTRVVGGWERTALSLPASGHIRARGRTTSGAGNGSSGLVEEVAPLGLLSPFQQWKLTHLGDANAPDLVDPDGDGLTILVEFAYGLNPTLPDAGDVPQFQRIGGDLAVSFPTPAGVSGISYGAEWSSTLQPGSWTPIPDTGAAGLHSFRLPMNGGQQFLRLRVVP